MEIFIAFLTFALGASLGSFLSVLIHRLGTGKKGIILGRSACPSCKKPLGARELIPVISYFLIRGKCRHCKKNVSATYLVLEIISGLVLLALYSRFPFYASAAESIINWPNLLSFLFHSIYGIILIGMFFYDLKYKQIPNIFLYALIITAFFGGLVTGYPAVTGRLAGMGIAFLIALAFFGGQILISKGKWLGEGDLYLGIGMAFILGWEKLLIAIVASYFIGSLICLVILLRKEANMKAQIPFAPFLVFGTFTAIFFGDLLLGWYSSLLIF